MDGLPAESEHPKKHRRRRQAVHQVFSARLAWDDNVTGDVGFISELLWEELVQDEGICHEFPLDQSDLIEEDNTLAPNAHLHHSDARYGATIFLAVRPRLCFVAPLDSCPWTTLPVRKHIYETVAAAEHFDEYTVSLPTSSNTFSSVQPQLDKLNLERNLRASSAAITLHATRVQPLILDTIYILVESNLLDDVDDAQRRFGGGFANDLPEFSRPHTVTRANGNGSCHTGSETAQDRLTAMVREAVQARLFIRAGDRLTLPLPSHPITHVSPPPAIVDACEPVSQGLMSPTTAVVLRQAGRDPHRQSYNEAAQLSCGHSEETHPNDRNKTRDNVNGVAVNTEHTRVCHSEASSPSLSGSASDDTLEDMISLQAPDPRPQNSIVSAKASRHPREYVGQTYSNNLSPNSGRSSVLSTTSHTRSYRGQFYRTQALLKPLPAAVLEPRPTEGADDQAFVYVDIGTLTKIGCFSGDWIRMEEYADSGMESIGSLTSASLDQPDGNPPKWRAALIFGLHSSVLEKHQRKQNTRMQGRPAGSAFPEACVYMSPVLLYNIGEPRFVTLSPLLRRASVTKEAYMAPPIAKEVSLSKISTPYCTRKEVQSTLFTAVKAHFQSRSRLLREGDLIAIPFDEELGRAIRSPAASIDEKIIDFVATRINSSFTNQSGRFRVAWFSVQQVARAERDGVKHDMDDDEEDVWNNVFMVDSEISRMIQSGNELRGIPERLARNTATWLGVAKLPPLPEFEGTIVQTNTCSTQRHRSILEERLTKLITAATSSRALLLGMPPVAILLHSTQRQMGKAYLAEAACSAAGVHPFLIRAHEVLIDAGSPNGGDAKAEVVLKAMVERAMDCGSQFTALLVLNLEALGADRMTAALSDIISGSRVVIATTTELEKLPGEVRGLFSHEFEVTAPDESERQGILYNACLRLAIPLDVSVNLHDVALKTAALGAGDLVDVVRRACLGHEQRVTSLAASKGVSESDVRYAGGSAVSRLLAVDFEQAIVRTRSTFADAIGAPKIPTVTWGDIGGLADQKSSIMETINLPLTRPELFARGLRKRSGILFYGPPGTGKTLLAKAIATEFRLNFFSIKGPELLNMYIGESEANVRRVFQRARDARPCIVFFDELDSVAPKRGNQGDSGGVMDRIVSQLLAELDGMSGGSHAEGSATGIAEDNSAGVFVVGATNRPDLLDPALLRPGRFDKMLYLGVPSSHDQQIPILKALTRKFTLTPEVDIERVAGRLPLTYTGADLYALCSDAMLKAITRKTRQIDAKVASACAVRGQEISTAFYFDHLASPEDTTVAVNEQDFAVAQQELNASVR